jgi:hypothetical protein
MPVFLTSVCSCKRDSGQMVRPSRVLKLSSNHLDAALRVAEPSTPAAGGPPSPLVAWREYFSAEHRMPYYYNAQTNETTWNIPGGFVSRFPEHHRALGNVVDASGAVWPPGTTRSEGSTDEGTAKAGPISLKKRLAALGGAGFLLYLIVHNLSLAIVFTMMNVFGFDLVSLAKSYGISVPFTGGSGGLVANFLVAVALNKTLVPLQIVLTLALAPRFAPMLQPAAKRASAAIGSYFKAAGL